MSGFVSPESVIPAGPIVVGLGEALFDCFGATRHVGGAPVNLAVHCDALLRPFEGRGVIASAIGSDALAAEFRDFLRERGLEPSYVQTSSRLPTGTVAVSLDPHGEPTYQIATDVAWDDLHYDERWEQLARTCDAVCFGSLAQRSSASRAAIQSFLRDATQALRLFDVNLRSPTVSSELLRQSLQLASAAKCNRAELFALGRMLECTATQRQNFDELAFELLERFSLQWLAVTHGSAGTSLYALQEKYEADVPRYERTPQADSVGAGDACGAGLLVGSILEWPYAHRVALANNLGSYVSAQSGAIPTLSPALLARVREPAEGADDQKLWRRQSAANATRETSANPPLAS